jgi:hypothetical protein
VLLASSVAHVVVEFEQPDQLLSGHRAKPKVGMGPV